MPSGQTPSPLFAAAALSVLVHAGGMVAFAHYGSAAADPVAGSRSDAQLLVPQEFLLPPVEPPEPPTPVPPPTPPPEPPIPEEPEIRPGIDASTAETPTWQGFETATEHAAPLSRFEQSAMSPSPGVPTPPGAPPAPPAAAPSPSATPAPPAVATPPAGRGVADGADGADEAPVAPVEGSAEAGEVASGADGPASLEDSLPDEPNPSEAGPVPPDAADPSASEFAPISPWNPDPPGDEPTLAMPPLPAPRGPFAPTPPSSAAEVAEQTPRPDGVADGPEAPTAVESGARTESEPAALPSPPSPVVPPPATIGVDRPGDRPAEESDAESDAMALEEAVEVRPGRVVAGKGLRIRTIKPRFSVTTQLVAQPKNAVVRVRFGRAGRVVKAGFLPGRGTGYPDVDGPLLDAIYRWTATGEALARLSATDPEAVIPMTFEIVLR